MTGVAREAAVLRNLCVDDFDETSRARTGGDTVRVYEIQRGETLRPIADPDHAQYCRELDLHSRAQLVAQGVGERGRCTDYIRHTLEHMYALGVTDPHLARVLETAEAMRVSADSSRAR